MATPLSLSYFVVTGVAMLVMLVLIARRFGREAVRAYSASSEEALRARNLLKDWAGEGFLTEAQYQRMEQETVCDLRRTNIFLRLVLFLFTLIIVGAARRAVLRGFSLATRGASRRRFPADLRCHLLCGRRIRRFRGPALSLRDRGSARRLLGWLSLRGNAARFLRRSHFIRAQHAMEFLVPAAGAIASLWIWRRFGLPYAFLAAMIFVVWLPGYWTSSHSAQHLIVAAFYAAGLITVAAVRPRHRFTYLNDEYSIAEALLWLGIYLAINLQLSSVDLLGAVVGWRSHHHRILKAVLLGHLGADLVPAARRAGARPARERPIRHRSGRYRRRPDPGHQ